MSLTYFAENNAGQGQLWVTDGTAAGTHFVKQFDNPPTFVGPIIINLVTIGGRAYFNLNDAFAGELWTSDGTAAGTTLVKNVIPGGSLGFFANVNGTLFFDAIGPTGGTSLWKSDGTAAGTTMVSPTAIDDAFFNDIPFASVNGTLFFRSGSDALWRSDGTPEGTARLTDNGLHPTNFTNVDGTLYFIGPDGPLGSELWRSDGTAAGTVLVKDINPGPGGSIAVHTQMVNINGTLFFEATDGVNGFELWKSDGTAAGTVMVKDISAGPGDSNPTQLTNVNGTLFFEATDATSLGLWKSDGTAAGTVKIASLDNGAVGAPYGFTNVNGTLFFVSVNIASGFGDYELWKSDGTAAGTVVVKDINPGSTGSFPFDLMNVNGVLEFFADDGTGEGLFRSDGTAAGTVKIASGVDTNTAFSFAPPPVSNDTTGDGLSDILWRKADGTLAGWTMNGGTITSSASVTSGGAAVKPDSSWSIAAISDFNGDGKADLFWRNTDGTLIEWNMNGSTIASSGVIMSGPSLLKPDASWSIAGAGDFDGDSRSDLLWRKSDGTLALWTMNGSTILSNGVVNFGGSAVTLDASWSVAGIGDFNGDGRRDILWRNTDGTLSEWFMNGSTISSSSLILSGGLPLKPDASWSVAGVGDFNRDGYSDILWRKSDGTLSEWLMHGSTLAGGGAITFNGATVTPGPNWHVVEVGDFNGDSASDILWRSDSGALTEWLMNGSTIVSSVTPGANGGAVTPDASWSTQAKPTIG